jgi:hypothetical protein
LRPSRASEIVDQSQHQHKPFIYYPLSTGGIEKEGKKRALRTESTPKREKKGLENSFDT